MVLACSETCTISTSPSQKGVKEEAGAARGDGVAVRQEDVVHHEAEEVAEEALEVIVVAEALGAAEAQEGSAVGEGLAMVVAVAEDLGEVVVVSEGHDIVFMFVKHGWEWGKNLERSSEVMKSFKWQSHIVGPALIHMATGQRPDVSSPNIRSYPLTMS